MMFMLRIYRLLNIAIGSWVMYEWLQYMVNDVQPSGALLSFGFTFILMTSIYNHKRSFDLESIINEIDKEQ